MIEDKNFNIKNKVSKQQGKIIDIVPLEICNNQIKE